MSIIAEHENENETGTLLKTVTYRKSVLSTLLTVIVLVVINTLTLLLIPSHHAAALAAQI
jgi:hypothetical protein